MYGITQKDIEQLDNKILRQKQFLSFGTLDIDGCDRKLIEFTYSANINPKKYFAEVNNRVNAIINITSSIGLSPVFVTITAPSQYHEKDNYGNLKIDPNTTAKALTQIFNDFTNTSIFKKIRKEYERGFHYIRTYEPHKSGVPHLHAILFLPMKYIKPLESKFNEYFTDKQRWGNNLKSLKYIYKFDGNLKGAINYIMKYILKTFKNEDTNKNDIQYTSYWFLKHRVRRFLSSRSLIPLSIYRKIRHYFKSRGISADLQKATRLYLNNGIYYDYDGKSINLKEPIYNKNRINIRYIDPDTKELVDSIMWEKKAQKSLATQNTQRRDTINLKYQKKKLTKSSIVTVDGKSKYIQIAPSNMSDYQLLDYYKTVDKFPSTTQDMHKYLIAHNEMVKRGLRVGTIEALTHKNLQGGN
jgi:hypothetical protein